jgi:kynurenine 3-monooxygenase
MDATLSSNVFGTEETQIDGNQFDFVIVGAGPAGLAAAGHLAKAGKKVAIFEGRSRPNNVFGSYPVVLNSRGLKSLEQLDPALVQRAADFGIPVDELHIVPENRTVAKVRTFGTGIMRDQTAQLLLEYAEAQPGVSFFWDYRMRSVDVGAHVIAFQDASGTTVRVSNIQRLVAADGNRSRIRRACCEQVEGFAADVDPWGFQLRFMTSRGKPDQTEVDPKTHFVLGDKGYVCQQPDGVWSISLRVLPGIDEDFLTAAEATQDRVEKLRQYCEKYAGFAAKNLLDDEAYRGFYAIKPFDGFVVKCSWLNPAGWICIIGDAAHAVQPATGEGINSGLEDAAVLGSCVQEEDPFAAFDARQRLNAHALNRLAIQARDKVVASPRQRSTDLIVTIGLGIAKKLRIIEGRPQDFMLGEMANTVGVKSYSELIEMGDRQERGLRRFAIGIGKIFRISKKSPLDEVLITPKTQDSFTAETPQQAIGA